MNVWKIIPRPVNGRSVYSVYRLRDAEQPDEADNREVICTCADERIVAEGIAAILNDRARRAVKWIFAEGIAAIPNDRARRAVK